MLFYLHYLGITLSLILPEHALATIKTRKYVLSVQKRDVWPSLIYKIVNFNRVPFVRQKCYSYLTHPRHFDKINLNFRFLNVAAPVSEIRQVVHALSKWALLVTLVTHLEMRLSSPPRRMTWLPFILYKVVFGE